MTYASEYGEDRWIAEHIKLPEKGVYLDVGAGHPQFMSNTAFLRTMGWTGLAVDANPAYAEHWNRLVYNQSPTNPTCPFKCAVISTLPQERFEFRENVATSRISATGTLTPAVTLKSLLDKHAISHVDFLSIDIEGWEYYAFQTLGIPWPKIIVAEYNTAPVSEMDEPKDFRLLEQLLESDRYSAVYRTIANIIYLERSVQWL